MSSMKIIARIYNRLYKQHLWTKSRFHLRHFSNLNALKELQNNSLQYERHGDTTGDTKDPLRGFEWISKHACPFRVHAKDVTVISEPKDYYSTLKTKIKQTKFRMTFAALYLGTNELETELVRLIEEKLKQSDRSVEVTVLLDYTRGRRGNPNSCTMLYPLLDHKGVQVSLFHTPYLRGLLKKFVPQRWNELIGLQHMKVNIFDDALLISGANLSNDYFVNRQDRYILIERCPRLCDYVQNIISTVALFSMQLKNDGSLLLHPSWALHPFESDKREFKLRVKEKILATLLPSGFDATADEDGDTIVYPLIQMGHFGIKQDERVTTELLKHAENGSQIILASGYFNLTEFYEDIILNHSRASMKILMAAPEANGFYGAKGVAGSIPLAYTQLALIFHEEIMSHEQEHRIKLYEYLRKEWTFHAKGLWYYLPNETLPSLTTIGSPNFGYRSVNRDLELQLIIATNDKNLRKELHKEHQTISKSCTLSTVDTLLEREIPGWVEGVAYFFRDYF